ncbi:MAG TPA: excinuclease ABC subunit UvrC [Thermoflexia bacterium]|nr:excinuclease ABC subunit UvrC [Thermoflexia bacterium]
MDVPEHIRTQIETLPRRPGVYLMRDAGGTVIYVGKAVDLRARVRSYFHVSAWENPKVRAIVSEIADVDFIVTDSELEALILEANLIKEHRPRYNVRLKDDKRYPYIKITWADPFPKVLITRRMEQDGSRYFGPFTSSSAVHQTLDLLRKSFPYLTCNREITGHDERPCLYYDIKLCLGPCIGAVTQEEYRAMIRGLVRFLEGRSEEVIADLEARMKAAADEWDFEQAASLRDQLRAVQRIVEKQKIVSSAGIDQDVIAFAREEGDACVQVFFIRGGKLLGREYFVLEGARDEDEREVMAAFLKQFYEEAAYVPPEVLLPEQIEEALVIEQWLRGKRGAKVTLRVPRRGQKRELVALAAENAAETLAALRAQWQADAHKHEQALAELQEALGLSRPPVRIECYDISTMQGTEVVGSMVVFVHAVPRKSDYRRFVVRSVQGQDDYASMREVLQRRFRRWQMATSGAPGEAGRPEARLQPGVSSRDIKGWAKLPDLLIVDGGKGQLGVAVEVLKEFDLLDRVPVAALAKQREEIFLPGRTRPILLPRRSQALFLVQRVRDEAHRFAVTHHRARRRRAGVASQLDSIPGVGPARRKALLKAFGSLDAIRAASVEQLAAVPGIPRTVAQAIKEHL